MSESASHRYYRPKHGRWRSALRFAITDWRAFWRSEIGFVDRLRVIAMAISSRIIGPSTIETEVDYEAGGGHGEVVHRTRVGKWGSTLFRSEETITLHENGRDAILRGEQRFWPTPWRARSYGGTVRIDETGTRAEYELEWLGVRMRQRTHWENDALVVTQETGWSSSSAELRMQ